MYKIQSKFIKPHKFAYCLTRNLSTNGDNFEFSGRVHNHIPPKESRVVICGGGLMAASVAYHLGLAGWGEHTTIVDQGRVGQGSIWHNSGVIGTFKQSNTQIKMARKSIKLLEHLEALGYDIGWKQCGSLNLARTRDRMTTFRRMKSLSE